MAKFKYLGGDPWPSSISIYGADWEEGEVSEVEDPRFIEKVRTLAAFEEVTEDEANGEPKKRGPGRPKLTDEAKAARAEQKYKPVTDVGPEEEWPDA